MTDINTLAAQLLVQILSLHSPEPGARLKQLLKKAFISNGHTEFDEKALGFPKFTDYLIAEHGNILRVDKPDGSGDVSVSLRHVPDELQPGLSSLYFADTVKSSPNIRNDLWQAFVNPDPNRLRFFHLSEGRVVHYLKGAGAKEEAEINRFPNLFLAISPISLETQSAWMKSFLTTVKVSPDSLATLEALASKPYSSETANAFMRSLGQYASAWKAFRSTHVVDEIKSWAHKSKIEDEKLYRSSDKPLAGLVSHSPLTSPKHQVLTLLDLLSEEDVSRCVLPVVLSAILIKSRS